MVKMVSIETNSTGNKDCSKPYGNPYTVELFKDFADGWSLIQCSNFVMDMNDGEGSLFASGTLKSYDF